VRCIASSRRGGITVGSTCGQMSFIAGAAPACGFSAVQNTSCRRSRLCSSSGEPANLRGPAACACQHQR
jgi:hypothetical protein